MSNIFSRKDAKTQFNSYYAFCPSAFLPFALLLQIFGFVGMVDAL